LNSLSPARTLGPEDGPRGAGHSGFIANDRTTLALRRGSRQPDGGFTGWEIGLGPGESATDTVNAG
jgi:hypothetical protein